MDELSEKPIPEAAVAVKPADWSRPKIVMALWERGFSLRSLSRANDLAPKTLNAALDRPWPRGERIIAEALGVAPEEIWPSRFEQRAARKKMREGRA